jgi:hypothetical protein
MDPFIHLSVFKVVVCTVCQHAVLPGQISPHLSSSNSHNMTKEARERIADKVNQLEGLILGRAELDKLPIPITSTLPPIPELGQPRIDGKKCPFVPCTYISCQRQAIQKHCREEHGWVNARKRGGQRVGQEMPIPWISVHCQQFFPKGSGSAFFEVQAAGSRPAIPSGDVDLEAIKKRLNQEIQQAEEEARRQITEPEESREPNPWLRRVGWVEHLGTLDRKELRALIAPVKDDEPELEVLCKAFDWLIQDV